MHCLRSLSGAASKTRSSSSPEQLPASDVGLKAVRQPSRTLSAAATFKDIPDGTYAISVLHDQNDYGKMDKNIMGIPKEGYGASNNPRKRMGPPGFDEAKFSVNQPQQTIEIKLMY